VVTKVVTDFVRSFPVAQQNFRRIQNLYTHPNVLEIMNLADMGVSLYLFGTLLMPPPNGECGY